ncbi:hypothetical protein LXH13_38895 [Streptomyces spinosirectus]|jgi:hypothetical protein|uniref:hypothetical protein n=1 Tax=Streptomyces TaxID=1883 RepID=UPI000D3C6C99|nr:MULTISPECIES: hypothetical protein [Streptomyces]MBY8344154.1 hypothetical protein [Streptomyces plumbidurans]PTM86609.1 hypothetical protein C7821_117129 [Streptomyces sp. VMFN-G11Ma]UIR22649.1 hypothetical protein LXH13_38895 [Streptomyces spinosirectus]
MALPVAGDDPQTMAVVVDLADQLGFDGIERPDVRRTAVAAAPGGRGDQNPRAGRGERIPWAVPHA